MAWSLIQNCHSVVERTAQRYFCFLYATCPPVRPSVRLSVCLSVCRSLYVCVTTNQSKPVQSMNAHYGPSPHVSNPSQMSNCVNQRMEFRVFERFGDRDHTSRFLAVRLAPPPHPQLSNFGPFLLLPPLPIEKKTPLLPVIVIVVFGQARSGLTPRQTLPIDPCDPNTSDPCGSATSP